MSTTQAKPAPQRSTTADAALGRTLSTYTAIGDALSQERSALIKGDPRGLEEAIARLKSLVVEARNHDTILRAALQSSGEPVDQSAKDALIRAATNVRLLALRNAQLLVRARDLTRRLTASLEAALPALDRRA